MNWGLAAAIWALLMLTPARWWPLIIMVVLILMVVLALYGWRLV